MGKIISKIVYLDGIRGIAALFVFFHHFLLAFYSAFYNYDLNASNINGLEVKYGQSVLSVFSNGNYCVAVFFVLSGFVLSRKYFQTRLFEVIVSGAQRRFLRLYIPVAATLIISYMLMKAGLYYNVPVSKIAHSEWWFGQQWAFTHPLEKLWMCLKVSTMFLGDNSFDTSLWTMSIEFTGSLFVFAFLAFTHHTKSRFAALMLVFLYCKFTDQVTLSAFVFGISLNYAEQYAGKLNKYFALVAAAILLMLGLFLGSYPSAINNNGTLFDHMPQIIKRYAIWFHVLGAYALVLAFVISPAFQRAISVSVFRFLGYISFSLYLLHPIIIGSFGSYFFLKLYGHFDYNHSVAVVFILTISVTMFLSWLMEKYIDDPGIRFSKYVYNRWVKKDPVPQPVDNSMSHNSK
jgi:peptidoglycan/LPS O-acetylase OafA/YrhL